MRMLSGLRGAVAAAFAAAACLAAHAAAATEVYLSYSGTAVDPHTRKFLYAERHQLEYRDGKLAARVVLYACRDGAPFARKVVDYTDLWAPNFTLEDASNGLREGVRGTANERVVFFRGSTQAAERSGPLPRVRGLVADAGFDEFIRANWQRLRADETLPIRFLVPSRLSAMSFKIQRTRNDIADGVATEGFRLKLAGILGWILPGIDVYYSTEDRTLAHYVGLSDLRDAAGENMAVDIAFPRKDRAASDVDQFSSAARARLASCR